MPKVVSSLIIMRKNLAMSKVKLSCITAMDETDAGFKFTSSRTVTHSGEKTVSLTSTGHHKQNITVILAAAAGGTHRTSYITFHGKGQAKGDEALKENYDIVAGYSSHGWTNDELIAD